MGTEIARAGEVVVIDDVGATAWIACLGVSRCVLVCEGDGDYTVTFGVRSLPMSEEEAVAHSVAVGGGSPVYAEAVYTDGAGAIVQLAIKGGETKALPPGLMLFHSFRLNFAASGTTGNRVRIGMLS